MTTYTFQAYPASAKATFTCTICGKAHRTRTFSVECTVNPFNKNADGHVRTPSEVRSQSSVQAQKQREEFMRRPVCVSCETGLSYTERKQLRELRTAVLASSPAAPEA